MLGITGIAISKTRTENALLLHQSPSYPIEGKHTRYLHPYRVGTSKESGESAHDDGNRTRSHRHRHSLSSDESRSQRVDAAALSHAL
jgi:hypothetical protein